MHYTPILFVSWAALAMSVPTHSRFAVRQYTNTSDSSAAPASKNPGLLYINGEPVYVDGQEVGSLSSPGADSLQSGSGSASGSASTGSKLCDAAVDDVLTCALNKRNMLLNPDDAVKTGASTTMTGGHDGCYLQLEYDSHFSQCTVSDPKFISREPLISCGMDTCSETFTWQEATTDTNTYGIKMSSKQSASGNIGVVKAEIDFGEEFSDTWTNTDVVTTSHSTTRTMKLGNMCSWSNIQFFVDCQTRLSVSKFTVYQANGNLRYSWLDNVCSHFTDKTDRENFVRGQGFSESVVTQVTTICEEATMETDPNGLVRLDLGDGTVSNAKPWSIQGCMFD